MFFILFSTVFIFYETPLFFLLFSCFSLIGIKDKIVIKFNLKEKDEGGAKGEWKLFAQHLTETRNLNGYF